MFLRLLHAISQFPECFKWLILLILFGFINALEEKDLPISSLGASLELIIDYETYRQWKTPQPLKKMT